MVQAIEVVRLWNALVLILPEQSLVDGFEYVLKILNPTKQMICSRHTESRVHKDEFIISLRTEQKHQCFVRWAKNGVKFCEGRPCVQLSLLTLMFLSDAQIRAFSDMGVSEQDLMASGFARKTA